MGLDWETLLDDQTTITAPWLGGRVLNSVERSFKITGTLPAEFGWYSWKTKNKEAALVGESDPIFETFRRQKSGYLVGDRLFCEGNVVPRDVTTLHTAGERIFLIPPGLDRFSRISAGVIGISHKFVFMQQEFPQGPELDVLEAYLEEAQDIAHIKGVSPALALAFRLETYNRAEAERRRAQLEAERVRRERIEQAQQLMGTAQGRRSLVAYDFKAAAEAALKVGNATYVDHRQGRNRNEWIVRYRVDTTRLECVCDSNLRIIDAGVCLTDEHTGEKGDTYFTLESLPGVIKEAIDKDILVIYRH